jgi:hypothetical protein
MHVEAAVFPRMQKTNPVKGEQVEFDQGLDGEFGKGKELAVAGEQAVANGRVDVGMKIEVFAKGVEGENDGGMRLGFAECRTEIQGEALLGASVNMAL